MFIFHSNKYKRGLTLVEVMVAAVFIIIAIIALLGVFTVSLNYISRARELHVATDDLKDVLEKIKSTAFVDITTVFPDDTAVPESVVGTFQLDDEVIIVNYPDGTADDPLEIEVTITWTGRAGGQTYSHTFKTLRTSML